jgi:hypothetical protein
MSKSQNMTDWEKIALFSILRELAPAGQRIEFPPVAFRSPQPLTQLPACNISRGLLVPVIL